MSGPTRPSSGGAPRQPWTPDQTSKGVTCPACGLANETGARVCRNCGLPIASSSDPLRGVSPGHVDMPSTQRSGLSATVGLGLVVGLLLVAGTLAVSGGGILTSGGRLGVGPAETASAEPAADGAAVVDGPGADTAADGTDVNDENSRTGDSSTISGLGTSFEYTCEDDAIRDFSKTKWFLSQFKAGERLKDEESFDRITWEMSRKANAKKGATVTMEWTTPKEARTDYGASLVSGRRALVVTFDGPVDITAGQKIDELLLEPEGVEQIRTIDMLEGEDGKVRTVIGLRGDSCVRMSALGWKKKSKGKNAKIYLDVEKF